MLDSIRNIFSIPDLRRRIIFTLLILAVYRIGAQIPNPGISASALAEFWQAQKGTIFGFIDLFSGRNMSRMTIFALGIMPYISSSIILQLLQVVWPYLERLSKEGEMGRKKITQYTRYGTILICVVQSWGISLFLQAAKTPGGASIVPNPGLPFQLLTVLTLTTGTVFIMWLGEQISERGIGNGISLIIFAGIVVDLPRGVSGLASKLKDLGRDTPINLAVSLNATDNEVREMLMPVNRKYPLEKVLDACRKYPLRPRRRITFEYILIKGINDSIEDAHRLVKLLRPIPAKINLIPFNTYEGSDFKRPSESVILKFQDILAKNHYTAIIRQSKGKDISAACGQLRARAMS